MKPLAFARALLVALGVVLATSGCSHLSSSSSSARRTAKTFALAVTLPDGSTLSPEQWAAVKDSFKKTLADQGSVLVDELSEAEQILRVEFAPLATDPTSGHATVLSVRSNPVYAYRGNVRNNRYPSFAYAGNFGHPLDLHRGYDSYFGYNNSSYYSGGYTSNPGPVTPPTGRPVRPEDCPPGTERPHHGGNNHHASADRSWNRGDRGDRHPGYSRSEPSYSRSEPSSSSSGSNSPSASPSPSYSDSSSSSSYSSSSSSYSSPSSSPDSGSGMRDQGVNTLQH